MAIASIVSGRDQKDPERRRNDPCQRIARTGKQENQRPKRCNPSGIERRMRSEGLHRRERADRLRRRHRTAAEIQEPGRKGPEKNQKPSEMLGSEHVERAVQASRAEIARGNRRWVMLGRLGLGASLGLDAKLPFARLTFDSFRHYPKAVFSVEWIVNVRRRAVEAF
jgi:hypothetical protein